MKKAIFVLAVMIMGVGCTKQDDMEVTTPAVATPAVEEVTASDGPDAYYEYLWCNEGEDFSQEKLA